MAPMGQQLALREVESASPGQVKEVPDARPSDSVVPSTCEVSDAQLDISTGTGTGTWLASLGPQLLPPGW